MYILPGILSFFVPVLIIGAIVYLIVRRRNGGEGITSYHALLAYFYVIIAASIITAVWGIGSLLSAAFTTGFDGEAIADQITLGFTLLGTGSIICALHIYGRRAVEKEGEKATATLRRVHLFFMLGVFSIAGLISLPIAINDTVRYYIEESRHSNDPAEQLAAAIVTVPLWVYYVLRVLRETRHTQGVADLVTEGRT